MAYVALKSPIIVHTTILYSIGRGGMSSVALVNLLMREVLPIQWRNPFLICIASSELLGGI
jgi:hypothetical protein